MALSRIVLHWTAGAHKANAKDLGAYHYVIEGDGTVRGGSHPPEANQGRLRPGHYAAHTANLNTGSIGVALAAMAGAKERPFSAGRYPITPAQVEAMAALCARLCARYGIAVTRQTVLTHAEVQPTLGVRQAQKWDITWLPGMKAPGDPVQVGDRLRTLISAAMRPAAPPAALATLPPAPSLWARFTSAVRRLFNGD